MAKYYGAVGFSVTKETAPGVCALSIEEHFYAGDLLRNGRRNQNSGNLNNNIVVTNEISILADPFAYSNFHSIAYAVYMGAKWEVSSVNVEYPRLILTLGGVYNGPENSAPEDTGDSSGE